MTFCESNVEISDVSISLLILGTQEAHQQLSKTEVPRNDEYQR